MAYNNLKLVICDSDNFFQTNRNNLVLVHLHVHSVILSYRMDFHQANMNQFQVEKNFIFPSEAQQR